LFSFQIKFIRECLFVAHPQLGSLITLEGEAEEDGSILANSSVHLPNTGEKDPFGISNGQSLMWETSLLANHVSLIFTLLKEIIVWILFF